MRGRGAIATAIVGVSLLAGALPASAGVGPAGVTSDNVEHVRNIPRHADSSGARLVGKYFYITTGRDLAIYDVSTPEDPQLVGSMVLPQISSPPVAFPEEDVDTNGRVLLVENQETLFVIDVRDKAKPALMGQAPDADMHTVTCVLDCTYAYGDNGKIFDLRNPAKPVLTAGNWKRAFPVESSHDVTEVAPGVILTASQPMRLLDARLTPTAPTLLQSGPKEAGRFIHATRWPRQAQDSFLLVGGEDVGPQCSSSKSSTFSTWSASTFQQIDEYRIVPNASGTTAPDSTYCTHWFQEHPQYDNGGIVAISWYEHGTRFLRVGRDGQISEEGFFLPTGAPTAGQASAAYWITDRVVYVADYTRGLDVLRFKGNPSPTAPPAASPGTGSGDPQPGAEGGGGQGTSEPGTGGPKLSSYVYLPPMRTCVPQRGLRIGFRSSPPEAIRALAVYVNGKRVGFYRAPKPRSRVRVKLPILPGMVVRVAVRTAGGRLVSKEKAYRSCGARPATIIPAGTAGSRAGNVTRYGALCYLRSSDRQ